MMNTESVVKQSTPEERGQRLKLLRKMSGLTRKDIDENYDIKAATLRSWEEGKATGLTEQGAKRILSVFRKLNIYCTKTWLLDGIGELPYYLDQDIRPAARTQSLEDKIQQELNLFIENTLDPIFLELADDGMAPTYEISDIVAGSSIPDDKINEYINRVCIVQLANGEKLLRYIKKGNESESYTLACTNFNTTIPGIILLNVKISSIAEVLWHRKRK